MRQTVTIPPAGTKKQVELTGRSILVEQMNVYSGADQVPYFDMNPGTKNYPLYPGSQYPNDEGDFDFIYIWGTEESAGDDLFIMSSPECVELVINRQFLDSRLTTIGTTQAKTASNASQSFSAIELQNNDGELPTELELYVIGESGGTDTRGINYAFNRAPVQGDNAPEMYWDNDRRHNTAGDLISIEPLKLVGIETILAFEFIATVAGETPEVIWTPIY